MSLTFDPIKHQYAISGQAVPSVTQVLQATGFVDSAWFTDYGRSRGSLVHKIIKWDISGELDDDTVDPVLAPYLSAFRKFKTESGLVVSTSEVPMASEVYGFAGTPDIIGTFKDATCAIVDCKTGAITPWAGLQLAAYEILRGSPYKRFAVALKDNGTYSLKEFKDRSDRNIFLAALACLNWQRNHGRTA